MYHYALKAHTYTFSHGNYKFDLTFIMIVYILNYIHMYYIYLIHVHVACIKKKMQILILKHFLKTCIQQPKLQELHVVSLVKIFNTDKKK